MRSKKGSLSLSINAIVILVLAIAMLGLGLTFTKTMFSKFASKLEVPEPETPASAEEHIVLPTGSVINAKHGKDLEFTVNFYNDYGNDGTVIPEMTCSSGVVDANAALEDPDNILSVDQDVVAGQSQGFKFIIPGTVIPAVGTHICTIQFVIFSGTDKERTDTKQVTLKVN